VRLLKYHEASGTFYLLLEIVFCLYIVYFMVDEAYRMAKLGKKYWRSYWILADLGIIIMVIEIAINWY